ncbi:MAG: glycosyl hydrolase family 18 protein [Elusimicrobiota bacterium]
MGRRPVQRVHYSSWMVYWDSVNGANALDRYADRLEDVGVFAYHFDASGRLIPAGDMVRSHSPKMFITVVNDWAAGPATKLKDPEIVHQAIGTPQARAAHIQQLMELARAADGVEIDYERLDLADRDAFSIFIRELASALHAQKKRLSVVLQPRLARTPESGRGGAGTIDWKAVTESVDRVRVMAYFEHSADTPPGSIASLSWVRELAVFALGIVPPEKLCIALHLGGFDWEDGQRGRPIEYSEAVRIAVRSGNQILFDKDSGSGYFQYSEAGKNHRVWIETDQGLREKVELLRRLGIGQVGLWRLGSGDPAFWESLPRVP